MPRTNLDKGLQGLQAHMVQLGSHVEDALAETLQALETGNHTSLHVVIEADASIDALSAAAEEQALRILILQQPLGGQDLRLLTAALYISNHLGQIEDAIVEVAQTLLRAATLYRQTVGPTLYSVHASPVDQQGRLTDAFLLRGLLVLGGEIRYILRQAMEAFVQRDAVIARTVGNDQDLVELRYAPLCRDIMDMQAQHIAISAPQRDATFVQRITYLLWIAHKLAEMATHVHNICKRIIFIVKG